MVTGTYRHNQRKFMRNLLVASLLLSPVLLSAAVSAQPKGEVKADAPANTQTHRTSTGITAPQIVDPNSIRVYSTDMPLVAPSEGKVELSLNVDANGRAQDIKVVKSFAPEVDAHVVASVSKAQFRPATLDKQAVACDMNLVVVVRR
jgi:TonB family protein